MEKADLDAIAAASALGVKSAIADPETWRLGIAAMQKALASAAQQESGKWLVGWIAWMLRKAAGFVVIVGVLYYTGGLAAVMAYIKVK